MRYIFTIMMVGLIISSCQENNASDSRHHENFEKRTVTLKTPDYLESGKTYLPVYSQIYSLSEHKTHNLTVTASIRNIDLRDTIYIIKAEYFDTNANSLQTYFENPVYVAPLETIEIVIDEIDQEGGIGAHFIFDWKIKPKSTEPFFEGIMISTYGARGLSFTTDGKRIK